VVCGIGNCDKKYTAFAAYSSHIYRHHRVGLGLKRNVCSEVVPCHETGSDEAIFNSEIPVLECNEECTDDNGHVTSSPSLQTQAAKFLLQLRESYRVPQVALLNVIHTCNEMCTQTGNDIKQEIKDRLLKANICTDIIDDATVPHPFEGVNTIYLFEKYCVEHFNCLVRLTTCAQYSLGVYRSLHGFSVLTTGIERHLYLICVFYSEACTR
jgi:hypothetical protein